MRLLEAATPCRRHGRRPGCPREPSAGGGGRAGLLRGPSGPALLFIRMFERTGDPGYLDLAAAALSADLDRCVLDRKGALKVDEGWRLMPYLDGGSAGIGLVIDDFLAHRRDARFEQAAEGIRTAACSTYFAQPGLFRGRAGMLLYLSRAAAPDHAADDPRVAAHVRRLAWHAISYRGGTAFPGETLFRLSMDLATGTAGVLLGLAMALSPDGAELPCHHRPAQRPDDRRPATAATQTSLGVVARDGKKYPSSQGGNTDMALLDMQGMELKTVFGGHGGGHGGGGGGGSEPQPPAVRQRGQRHALPVARGLTRISTARSAASSRPPPRRPAGGPPWQTMTGTVAMPPSGRLRRAADRLLLRMARHGAHWTALLAITSITGAVADTLLPAVAGHTVDVVLRVAAAPGPAAGAPAGPATGWPDASR